MEIKGVKAVDRRSEVLYDPSRSHWKRDLEVEVEAWSHRGAGLGKTCS